MSLAKRIAAWAGWPLIVATDAALSAIAIALGYEWSRWALALMVAMSAIGWTLVWVQARELACLRFSTFNYRAASDSSRAAAEKFGQAARFLIGTTEAGDAGMLDGLDANTARRLP